MDIVHESLIQSVHLIMAEREVESDNGKNRS